MTAGSPANRRVFLIEFVAQDDPIVDALNNITTQLTELVDHIAKANASVTLLGTDLEKNAQQGARAQRSASLIWTDSLLVVGAAYLWLKKVIGGMITSAYELGEVVARSTRLFNQSGASASALAESYLDMGRNASEFMRASILMERANIRGEESLRNMTTTAFQFGKVMGISTEQAAESLAKLRMRLQLTEQQLIKTASAAATLARELNVSNEALFSAQNIGAGAIQTFQLEQHALMGFAGAFERAGLVGSKSGAFLNKTFTQLADVTQKYKLSLMGVNTEQLQAALQTKNYEAAMGVFTNAVGNNAQAWAKRMRILKLASEDEIAAFINLAKNREQSINMMRESEKAYNDSTNLSRIFGTVTGHLVEQLKLLWEEITAVGTKIGIFLAPILSAGVMLLRSLVAILHIIPTPIVGLIGAFGVLGISLLGGLFAFGKLVKLLGYFREGLSDSVSTLHGYIRATLKAAETKGTFANALAKARWNLNANRPAYGNAIQHLVSYAAAQGLSAIATVKNTIAMIQQSAVMERFLILQKFLAAATAALTWAEEILVVVRKQGVLAGLAAFKVSLLAALGYQTGAAAAGQYAAATGAATTATAAFSTALYSIPVIGWIAAGVTGLALALYGLYRMLTSTSESVQKWGIVLGVIFFPLTMAIAWIWMFVKALKFLWNVGEAVFGGLGDVLGEMLAPLDDLYKVFQRLYASFTRLFGLDSSSFFESIRKGSAFLFRIWSYLNPQFRIAIAAVRILGAMVVGFFSAIYEAMIPVVREFKILWNTIVEVLEPLGGLFDSVGNSSWSMTGIMMGVAKTVADILVPVFKIVAAVLRVVIGSIQATISAFRVLYNAFFGTTKDMRAAFEDLERAILNIMRAIVSPFESIWNLAVRTKKALFGSSFLHIKEGIMEILPYIEMLLSPFDLMLKGADVVKSALGGMWDSVKDGAGEAVKKVTEFAGAPFKAIGEAASWVKGLLFGSGFLHIKEGVMEAVSSVGSLEGSFKGFGDLVGQTQAVVAGLMQTLSAAGVGPTVGVPVSTLPSPVAARARADAVTAVAARTLTLGTEGGAGGGTAAAGGPSEIRITVPVMIDGEQVATAVARVSKEQLIRHGNAPGGAMRGIPL